MPRAAKGVEKVAVSEAIMPSHSVAEVTLAPIAGPFTVVGKAEMSRSVQSAESELDESVVVQNSWAVQRGW